MPLPIAHGVLGASILVAVREPRDKTPLHHTLLLGFLLGNLPDVDLVLAWLLGWGAEAHGGWTHSFFFAAVIGLVVGGWRRRWRAWVPADVLLYGSAVLTHGVLDMLVRRDFGGVALYWPLTSEKLRLGLFDYFSFYPGSVPLDDAVWRALQISFYELLIFGPFLLLVWGIHMKRVQHATMRRLPRAVRWPVRID